MLPATRERGFSLIEALIASLLIAVAIVSLAQLIVLGADQSARVRRITTALTLAQSKLEELRSATWRFDAAGTPESSSALTPSPPSALVQDSVGYVDTLDRFGYHVGPDAAHHVRRWAVGPLDAADPDTLVLQVCVFGSGASAEACVWGIRTRRP